MRSAIFLSLLFLTSLVAPLAASATTETQFKDGSTSYTHTFNGAGTGSAGVITIPYGAEVTSAGFELEGDASQTTYTNFTTDANFGGAGTTGSNTYISGLPSPYTSGYRQNVEVSGTDVSLRPQPTTTSGSLASSSAISSTGNGVHNTTGGFVALGDQGYTSPLASLASMSTSSTGWSYSGVTARIGDEIHRFQYPGSSLYNTPSIYRYNASTGSYIGTASFSYGSCTSSVYYNIFDATVDSSGNAWLVHNSYYYISKWTATSSAWTCTNYWSMSSYGYLTGIDFDESTGDLWATSYDSSSTNQYLLELNPSTPTSINGSWSLGTSSEFNNFGANNQISGLDVNYPRVTVNEYNNQGSRHHFYTFSGSMLNAQGYHALPGGGHYGLAEYDDTKLMFTCFYSTSYCGSTYMYKFQFVGSGMLWDARTPTSTSAVVQSAASAVSGSVSQVKVAGMFGLFPSGTSASLEISNDGGSTWTSASIGQTVTFGASGSQIAWRVTLSGTSSQTPILDGVVLEYTNQYSTSGYIYGYQYTGGTTNIVAATVHWNATTPAGTSVKINLASGASSTSCSSGQTGVQSFTQSGQSKTLTSSSYYACFRIELSTSSQYYTPTLEDLHIEFHANVPKDVSLKIANSTVWTKQGNLFGAATASSTDGSSSFLTTINSKIPSTGAGYADLEVELTSATAGILNLVSFSLTYTMQTVNLAIQVPEGEVLHARMEPYEIVTRHIIGESANGLQEATLTLLTTSAAANPTMTWNPGDSFPDPNDPEDYIEVDPSSYSVLNNGILDIHWRFTVTPYMPDMESVGFRTNCLDDSGSAGYTPALLQSDVQLRANRSYGLGFLKVRDNDGELTREDVTDGSWVAAGEELHFTGAMWFMNTQDAPLDEAFDVRIARNNYVEATARDNSNNNGTFFVTVQVPNLDIPDGITYEVQTYNEQEPTHVLPRSSEWSRLFRVDATAPEWTTTAPAEDAYEAAAHDQPIRVLVQDDVGVPMSLTLNYWVEQDHDLNRNGKAEPEEYVTKTVTNTSEANKKWFVATIDHSRNPNMGRVSYFWSGGDQAGNPLYHEVIGFDEELMQVRGEAGFDYDDATFRTRKDSTAVFTGLEWVGHTDDAPVYAGLTQTITLGFIDANTAIDFEHISLVFDFEGPNPARDAQRVSYSGLNDTFWSESPYITVLSSSEMVETTNESGLPWIIVTFQIQFGWDWPDEEMGDVALLYKERASEEDSRILLLEHTFRVENDLVLAAGSFQVNDVSEPRTGPVADGTRVRKDDRLSFTGRVVYEGSDIAAPRDLGILVDVFDGEKIWSDGSLTQNGGYEVEVPLSSATTLQSSPTRTCLISITNIPGRGEDMTGTLVSTTLRVLVDDAAPRVTRRVTPLNVIDVSAQNDLSSVPVEFLGSEDADLTGSVQTVHWVMRDATRTITIGAGSSPLGMRQDGMIVTWTGTVDLTAGGAIQPREGDFVGFFITGYDAAGNDFPVVSNSEASPIPELAEDDVDFERQWVRLGAVGPELRVASISLSDDHIAPRVRVDIDVAVENVGGTTNTSFNVAFYAGDASEPFQRRSVSGLPSGEQIVLSVSWQAEDVDRIRVVVDEENAVLEANDEDNVAEHGVEVAYATGFAWKDSYRENPLAWMFTILSIVILGAVATIAQRTAIDHGEGAFVDEDDDLWEEHDASIDEDDYDDDEDEDDDD